MMDIRPVTLAGAHVRLEPLAAAHAAGLWAAGDDPEIWRYMPYGPIDSRGKMTAWVDDMLRRQSAGADLPFAVIGLPEQRPIGATRYMTIDRPNRSLEIGGTWLGRDSRRTAANTECKYLLLRHAFEALACIRVQFRTDVRNARSQAALERIGAVREGVLRKVVILPDGHQRSSVFYSILDEEWPAVRGRLESLLARP